MSCCDSTKIYDQVREHYSSASRSTSVKYGEAVAKSFGYSAEELSNIPQDANLGLSCGNPLAIASLREGETVVDLGSGAGFDVFLAAKKVGPTGQAIGVDMNDDMLARANQILSAQPPPTEHIRFVKSNITSIPALDPGSVDCVISNCVINLVPHADKPAVFREMHRLLRPGGRVAVSDILAKKELPPKLREDMALYVGCIAGASRVGEYEAWLREAGFEDIMIVDTNADLNVYLDIGEDGERRKDSAGGSGGCCAPAAPAPAAESGCCQPAPTRAAERAGDEKLDLNEFVGSYKIFAIKK